MKPAAKISVLVVAVATLALSASRVHAQAPGATADEAEVEPAPERYYSQTLIADGLGILAFVGGALSEDGNGRDGAGTGVLFSMGMGTSLLATPIIHAAHGNWGNAGKSFLMRVTIPFAMGALAMAFDSCRDDDAIVPCEMNSFGPGLLAGFALVSAIDAGLLAKKKRRKAERVWAPTAGLTKGGATVGFAAQW